MEAAFRRYRIMSFITGTTLLSLFVLLAVQHIVSAHVWRTVGFSVLDRVIGIGHGVILYPIYMFMCFAFALKARVHLASLVLMLLAGFVPGLAFYMEHWVARRYGFLKKETT